MTISLETRFRWQQFNAARDSLHDLPSSPGLVRSCETTDEATEVVVRDIRQWFEQNRGDLLAIAREGDGRPIAAWTAPHPADLDQWLVERMKGHETLRSGHPVLIRDEARLSEAPRSWGVYRIHRTHDDTWYIGISSNLRSRLRAHRRNEMYDFSRGDTVELILAKDPGDAGITTWSALQRAEALHIKRLRDAGKNVINITGGGNGNPPQVRFNAQVQEHLDRFARRATHSRAVHVETWHKVDIASERPIPGTEYPVLNLRMTWQDQSGDWHLHLESGADHIMALAPGEGPIHQVRGRSTVSTDWLDDKYARELPGRSLREDIDALGGDWKLPPEGALRYYMHKRKLRDDSGRYQTDPGALKRVSPRNVQEARLPSSISDNGFDIDPSFVQSNNINSVIRVARPGDSPVYLKTEENRAAVRAELLVSLLWHKLNWPGLGGRVTESEHGVLLIPALGAGGIEDQGPFSRVFRMWPDESSESMRTKRPSTIKRIGLSDLRLRNPLDVAKFVVVNAVTGNTDRHKLNLHLGRSSTDPVDRNGYLLPLDHGRCILNNDWGVPRAVITGTPVETVRGDVANPHQLLRPLSELVRGNRGATVDAIAQMLVRIGVQLEDIDADPAWAGYKLEVRMLTDRASTIAADVDSFLDECLKVVL